MKLYAVAFVAYVGTRVRYGVKFSTAVSIDDAESKILALVKAQHPGRICDVSAEEVPKID